MDLLYWIIIIALFVVAFIGLVYPIIPSVLFIVGAFLLYGVAFSFASLNIWFWLIQGLFVLLLFIADYLANIISVKKFGGSNASVWGNSYWSFCHTGCRNYFRAILRCDNCRNVSEKTGYKNFY